MTIEDRVRRTLHDRADAVSKRGEGIAPQHAQSTFSHPSRSLGSNTKRAVAGVVAFAVFAGAAILLWNGFHPQAAYVSDASATRTFGDGSVSFEGVAGWSLLQGGALSACSTTASFAAEDVAQSRTLGPHELLGCRSTAATLPPDGVLITVSTPDLYTWAVPNPNFPADTIPPTLDPGSCGARIYEGQPRGTTECHVWITANDRQLGIYVFLGSEFPTSTMMATAQAGLDALSVSEPANPPSPTIPVASTSPGAPVLPFTGTIAYIEGRQGFGPISLLDPATGTTTQLTQDSFDSIGVAWSPDRSMIAMARSLSEGTGEIVLVSASTGKTIRTLPIDPSLQPQDVDWSPDGTSLAFTDSRANLHVIGLDGYGLRTIDTGGLRALDIAWSPDSNEIAFVADQGSLAVVDAITGHTDVVLDPAGERVWFGPTWSPDGKFLAFSMTSGSGSAIYVIGRDGSGLIRLTDHAQDHVNPTWSPDGSWIAFEQGSPSDLYAVTPDGLKSVRLTEASGSEYGPDWG